MILAELYSLIVESVVTELSSVIKDKDKEQKILNAKELLLVAVYFNSSAVLSFSDESLLL